MEVAFIGQGILYCSLLCNRKESLILSSFSRFKIGSSYAVQGMQYHKINLWKQCIWRKPTNSPANQPTNQPTNMVHYLFSEAVKKLGKASSLLQLCHKLCCQKNMHIYLICILIQIFLLSFWWCESLLRYILHFHIKISPSRHIFYKRGRETL